MKKHVEYDRSTEGWVTIGSVAAVGALVSILGYRYYKNKNENAEEEKEIMEKVSNDEKKEDQA